jgi:hypothetical protein
MGIEKHPKEQAPLRCANALGTTGRIGAASRDVCLIIIKLLFEVSV